MKILILGAYGTFGSRLVRLLAREPRLTLIVTGRSASRAQDFAQAQSLSPGATLVAAAIDRNANLDEALERWRPDLLVDATGPFQAYGEEAYRVVAACLRNRVHYVDLADGADFVARIARHDEAARGAGVFILSGVSTLPALSFAAVRHLARWDGQPLEPIEMAAGIAPSPYAGVGLNVVRAILTYAGMPIRLWREGREQSATGLVDSMRFTIAPPAHVPLAPRRFSLVDVPDLRLMVATWPTVQRVWVGAAPVPAVLHRALSALSLLVRWRLLPSLTPLARWAHWACNTLRWGEARGGMFVWIDGRTREGSRVERSWHLVAEGDDGPFIPSMGIAALVLRCLNGKSPAPGARACTEDLEIADYEPFFAARKIRHGVRERISGAVEAPLYQRVLGSAWRRLPEAIRRLHGEGGEREFQGEVSVERGKGLAAFAAAIAGFPPASPGMPLRVSFSKEGGTETWVRYFGSHRVQSVQWTRDGGDCGLLSERLGPLTLDMALVVDGARLTFVLCRARLLGLAMPRLLAPTLSSYEEARETGLHFFVEVGHPWIGMIVRYRGVHRLSPLAAARIRERHQSSVM